jgi:hypothetical protein
VAANGTRGLALQVSIEVAAKASIKAMSQPVFGLWAGHADRRVFRLAGGVVAVVGSVAEQADGYGQYGQRDECDEDQFDVGCDERDLAEEIAEHGHTGAPQQATEGVEGREGAVPHVAGARDDGGEGAHDRYESGQDDRAGAVAIEESAGSVEVLLFEQPGVGAAEECRSGAAAECVADLVAEDRGEGDQGTYEPEWVCRWPPATRSPVVNRSESPGRKNPIRRPVSANTMIKMPIRPKVEISHSEFRMFGPLAMYTRFLSLVAGRGRSIRLPCVAATGRVLYWPDARLCRRQHDVYEGLRSAKPQVRRIVRVRRGRQPISKCLE